MIIKGGSYVTPFFLNLVLYFSFFPVSIYLFCLYFLYSFTHFHSVIHICINCAVHYIFNCFGHFCCFFSVTSHCLSLCLSINSWIRIGHCVNKNQLDAQLILSIFRQPLHVSGVSKPIIRTCNRLYTKIGTYYSFLLHCLLSWATDSHVKTIICTKCCIIMFVPPDDRPTYARNM